MKDASGRQWNGPEDMPPICGAEDVDAETVATYRGPVLAWCRGREWRIAMYVEEDNREGGCEFHGWLNAPDDGRTVEVLAWTELPEDPDFSTAGVLNG